MPIHTENLPIQTKNLPVKDEKPDIDDLKPDIDNLKSDIDDLKLDVDNLKSDIEYEKSDIEALKHDIKKLIRNIDCKNNIKNRLLTVYTKLNNKIFGRSDVMKVTYSGKSQASIYIKLLKSNKIIEPVIGYGKGKYKFK